MPRNASGPPLSYRDAGVDIDAGDSLIEKIKPFARRTLRPEVLAGAGPDVLALETVPDIDEAEALMTVVAGLACQIRAARGLSLVPGAAD